jgi:hypothetical protein
MSDKPRVEVPPDSFHMDSRMAEMWTLTGWLINAARRDMTLDDVASVMLSRITRELRREHGTAEAKAVLQGLVDTMEQVAEGDR